MLSGGGTVVGQAWGGGRWGAGRRGRGAELGSLESPDPGKRQNG